MTRPECQKLRDKLHGYRLGEGTPLERQKLELHLKNAPAATMNSICCMNSSKPLEWDRLR